ncbi:MAG: M14 family metallopeptidase, partial [Thermomicrobiales bacterium]|nr:M14 family metallopeptidase [Thermomicrobiales bacterium]
TFVAEALTADGASLGRWTCTPSARLQPFVAALGEDAGRVVVTTGGIMAADGDSWREVARVATDLEAFWDFWQRDILPDLLRLVEESGAQANHQPFFGELLAEVSVSEPNERLGVREENDSAAEALAEDIYFTTLDAIELFGQRTNGDTLSAPGPIIPIVRVASNAAPSARITLRAAPTQPTLPLANLRVSEVTLFDGELAVAIDAEIDGNTAPTLDRLRALASMDLVGDPSLRASVRLAGESVSLRLPLVAPLVASGSDDRPPMTENIHGDRVVDITAGLAAAPEISAWIEDASYQGRPLPALALQASTPGRLHSIVKSAIFKPTYLIVSRHHANEISSTNAAFQLAWLCAHDPEWRRYLDAVNIVVLPYENPDGAALHARLASFPEAATWKHHPARYNALGYEYGADHLDPDTRFGEARARGSIWRRWLPDVIVDNHGVPSHEWVQPFAGFGSPPRFRVSYWIVQALLYGIASYVDGPDNEDQRASVAALQQAVSAMVRDTDIGEWNRIYGASYREWGQSRQPDRFPGEFHDDMLWHIAAVDGDSPRRGFHLRYPRTTVLSWVTEVNDETAEGEHLELVARAHLLANKATLDLLSSAATAPTLRAARNTDGTTTWQDRPPAATAVGRLADDQAG